MQTDDPEIKKNVICAVTLEEKRKMDITQHLTEHYFSWIQLKKAVVWTLKVKDKLLRLAIRKREHGADMAQYDTGKKP